MKESIKGSKEGRRKKEEVRKEDEKGGKERRGGGEEMGNKGKGEKKQESGKFKPLIFSLGELHPNN